MSGILIALTTYALAVALLYGARWFEGEARRARGERARRLAYPPRRPDVWRRYDDPTFPRGQLLIRSETVVARPRKLKAEWSLQARKLKAERSLQAVADLRTMWGMDAESEILHQGLEMIHHEETRAVACYLIAREAVEEVFADWDPIGGKGQA